MTTANDRQEGGSHYMRHEVEPWDIVAMYGLDFFDGNVIKYVLRQKGDDRVADLKKARHYLDKKIELLQAQGQGKTHHTYISDAEYQRRNETDEETDS